MPKMAVNLFVTANGRDHIVGGRSLDGAELTVHIKRTMTWDRVRSRIENKICTSITYLWFNDMRCNFSDEVRYLADRVCPLMDWRDRTIYAQIVIEWDNDDDSDVDSRSTYSDEDPADFVRRIRHRASVRDRHHRDMVARRANRQASSGLRFNAVPLPRRRRLRGRPGVYVWCGGSGANE